MKEMLDILDKYLDKTIKAEPLIRLLINHYSNDPSVETAFRNYFIKEILRANEMQDVINHLEHFFGV